MKISDHAKFRYVQRMKGVKDPNKAWEYVHKNQYQIAYEILELLNASKILYKNYAPTRKETLDYYINGELLLVVNKDEVTTLYNVTLDREDKTNTKKIKEYVNLITKNINRVKQNEIIKKKQDQTSDHLSYMINRLEGQVKEELIQDFKKEYEESVEKCKEIAATTKELRLENREMMSQMFKKLKG